MNSDMPCNAAALSISIGARSIKVMCGQSVDSLTSTFRFLETGAIGGVGGERVCLFPCVDVIE